MAAFAFVVGNFQSRQKVRMSSRVRHFHVTGSGFSCWKHDIGTWKLSNRLTYGGTWLININQTLNAAAKWGHISSTFSFSNKKYVLILYLNEFCYNCFHDYTILFDTWDIQKVTAMKHLPWPHEPDTTCHRTAKCYMWIANILKIV